MYPFEHYLKPAALELLKEKENYFTCFEEQFQERIELFLSKFEAISKLENRYQNIIPLQYPDLPYSINDFEWQFRQHSLDIVINEIKSLSKADILEVGSWNGWLSNKLTAWNHSVLATDYFTDEKDGLKAKKYYQNQWTSLQMNLEDAEIFRPKVFDVIVINHALQFFPDPKKYISQIIPLLKPNGKILIIGLSIYKNPNKKRYKIQAFRGYYKEKYNFEIQIHPAKGYLNFIDKMKLTNLGFEIRRYPQMWFRNFIASILTDKPQYFYAVYRNVK
jgi:2-polyprenyl-3-methyl-5-hydroxy-6-metoxy-1,4-benzoquinol methylase